MNKNKKYFLAVDGGGSKTELLISNMKGEKLYSVFIGSSSHKAVGKDTVLLNLQSGLAKLQDAGYEKEEIMYSVWGMSGCDSDLDFEYFNQLIQELGFAKNHYYLCNDAIPAYYAEAQGPGMILIGGTGSITFGVTTKEQILRLGGWGYGFSDCGGGYWIGNEVLKNALLYADNQIMWDSLFELVLSKSGCKSYDELGYKISELVNFSAVAQYAPLVFQAKESLIAQRIIREATIYMAELGASMYKKLLEIKKTEYQVVLSGGLFGNSEYYKKFENSFCEQTGIKSEQIHLLKQSPCVGGINIAMKKIQQN